MPLNDMPATIIPKMDDDDNNKISITSKNSSAKYSINGSDNNDNDEGKSNPIPNPMWEKIEDVQRYGNSIIQSGQLQGFLGLVLLVSLFMSDAWIAGNANNSVDDAKDAILLSCFIIFCIEMIATCFVQSNYLFSMMVWLDALGTVSLILDISWISDTFLPTNTNVSQGSIIRTARIAKLAARFGRILRIIKLIRFIKFIPCLSSKTVTAELQLTSLKKVTEELSNLISIRVAILVLVTVIVMPFLSYDGNNPDVSVYAWINVLKYTSKSGGDLQAVTDKFVSFYRHKSYKVLAVNVQDYTSAELTNYYYNSNRDDIRAENMLVYEDYYSKPGYTSEADKVYLVLVEVDATIPRMWDAKFGIIIVVMILLFLFLFTASLQIAVDRIIVEPLDHLMSTLRRSATAMLKSVKAVEEKEGGVDDDDIELETAMLEKMVEKLSRIVTTMTNDKNVDIGKDVDTDTANWLSKTYNSLPSLNNASSLGTTTLKTTGAIVQSIQRISKRALSSSVNNHSFQVDEGLLNSWRFDVVSYTHEQLYSVVEMIFTSRNCVDEFNIPLPALNNFTKAISSRYIENSYHNFKHGCDVFHTCDQLIQLSFLCEVLSPLEVFAIYVGALAHDVGHPGVNNPFLVNTKHQLALLHNDKSPLENMHCSLLYEILTVTENNIMVNLSDVQWRGARKIIITSILGTDMSNHFEQIKHATLFLEVNGEETKDYCKGKIDALPCMDEEKNRMLIMELVLHCSDISNPFKTFDLCKAWAQLIVVEFGIQGDKEKAAGIPISPMMDREQIVLCNMQMGFIEYVVAPLLIAFVQIFPSLYSIGINMRDNYSSWGEMRRQELADVNCVSPPADREGEMVKITERIQKFNEKFQFCDTFKSWPYRNSRITTE